jgi:hypothetical protein
MNHDIKSNLPLPVHFARKHYETKIRKWRVCQEKMEFILRHELATDAERDRACQWLRTIGGWNESQIAAMKGQRR